MNNNNNLEIKNTKNTTINLYEDNAGGLHLHGEGDEFVTTGYEHADADGFADDCESYYDWCPGWEDSRVPWTDFASDLDNPRVCSGDRTKLVATWTDGVVTIHDSRGASASRALAREIAKTEQNQTFNGDIYWNLDNGWYSGSEGDKNVLEGSTAEAEAYIREHTGLNIRLTCVFGNDGEDTVLGLERCDNAIAIQNAFYAWMDQS